MNIRTAVGGLAARVLPGLDEYVYNRDRNRQFPQTNVRLGSGDVPNFRPREPHIVVAALEGPGSESWGPAQGNYYYEIFQSAIEHLGESAVSVLDVGSQGREDWGEALQDLLRETNATHLIAHMERDPGRLDDWNWDVVWSSIARWWDGVFVGIMWDSGFDLLQWKGRRLARMSPNLLGLDICVPIDERLVGRPEVGPVPLVESLETQEALNRYLDASAKTKTSDVSFIGALYPYRQKLLEQLETASLRVAVNPHRKSDGRRSTWLEYMHALASSEMTLNFSLASSGQDEQLKCRVIEAPLSGTLLLTDDITRTKEFFAPGREFDSFTGTKDLPRTVSYWLDRPEDLLRAQRNGQKKARRLATQGFWEALRSGLDKRSLPELHSIT